MLPHSILRSILRPTALVAVVAFVFACDDAPTAPVEAGLAPSPTSQAVAVDQDADQHTAFQRSLMQQLAARQAQGLPVPRAEYTYEETTAGPPLLMAAGADEPPTIVSATTVIAFDNPGQAGLAQWPAVVVEGEVPEGAEGYVRAGDYTQQIKDAISSQHPDAWTGVTWETGPRTYTVQEDLVFEDVATPNALSLLGVEGQAALTAADEILLGFTVEGPNISYTTSWDLSVCIIWFFGCQVEWEIFDFEAVLALDWDIGVRLPMAISVTSDDPVLEGSTFAPLTAAAGTDWGADDYEAAGVAPQDGNEFDLVFVLMANVSVEISGADVVTLGVNINVDDGASFTPPLGSGTTISLPTILIPVWGFDVSVAAMDLGVSLTPEVGSDKYTADWVASAQGAGSGAVEYTTADENIPLGTVTALDGPGNAAVTLSDFRYYFTEFVLDLGAFMYFEVLSWDHTFIIPVTDFDLGGVTGGLYLETHEGTPGSLDLMIPIENVAPTVVLSQTGTIMIHGVPTYLAVPGQALTFTGTAADPGQDDLTLRWDWDDGDPAPDVTTDYEVPYSVTESQTHAFADACVYQVALSAVDDDLAEGEDHVAVLVAGLGSGAARLEGYWQHQLGQQGNTEFDEATLDCYLGIVAYMSAMFSEELDVSSIPAAHAILSMGGNRGDARAQFDRELLVLWLNFAHGAIGLDDLVDGDGDGVPEAAFSEMMAAAEALRMSADTDAKALRRMTQRLHLVSVALVS